jgi:hypothetical protein
VSLYLSPEQQLALQPCSTTTYFSSSPALVRREANSSDQMDLKI